MKLLLDTSAVVGWLERRGSGLPDLIRTADDVLIHPVTLGELATGVQLASTDDERADRMVTLDFATKRLARVPVESHLPVQAFAVVQAHAARRLSHNDMWIVAAALVKLDVTVVTEDRRLAALIQDEGFRSAVVAAGLNVPECELLFSRPA